MRTAIATLMIAVTLVSCSHQPLGPNAALFVTAAMSPVAFRSGERVSISVTVTNIGPESTTINTSGCPPWFLVQKGEAVVGPNFVCTTDATPSRKLAPGESHTMTSEWRGGVTEMLSPGAYTLSGRVLADPTFVQGAPIPFTILP